MNDVEFAQELLNKIGGKQNVSNLIHCITRLRFYLKDEDKADTDGIKKIPGVISVAKAQGQYQVVVGDKVNDYYTAVTEALGLPLSNYEERVQNTSTDEPNQDQAAEEASPSNNNEISLGKSLLNNFNNFIGFITGSMMPIIGLLAGAGIVKGLLAAFTAAKWISVSSGLYIILNTSADGIFHFLPVVLGYTAAR